MARTARRVTRLDLPRAPGRSLLPAVDEDWFGRIAERFARFMGTSRFLVYMTIFIALWLVWNILAPASARFDPYTFTFLTLLLSLQASYAAPLILLAQNRQDDRDRVNMGQDRDQNSRLLADAEYITREVASLRISLGEVVTRDYLRAELRAILDELDQKDRSDEDGRADRNREKRSDKARNEKSRSDKPRSDKQRPDRARTDKARVDRNRAEKARIERTRDERPNTPEGAGS
ncbi:MAG TPA: DUF1003 domain-containing protein [Frankiaceae bacterium]|nr:DUF1003 domain-containing protein [Frankiaceae bacterium]